MRQKNQLFKAVGIALLMASCGTMQSNHDNKMKEHMKIEENAGGSYSVILLNIHNEEGYNSYRKKSTKFLKQSGGYIEREFDVMGHQGNIEEFEAPNRIVVISWDSDKGHQTLMNNHKYKDISYLLKASSSNIRVVKGTSEMFQYSESNEGGRMYLIKMSYYRKNIPGRVAMLNEIGPNLVPYGFYTERMIMVNDAEGMDQPDEFTVHFHDFAAQNDELKKDTAALNAIGTYNEKFLTQFVYIPLMLRN